MIEKDSRGSRGLYFEPEFEDVLKATDLGTEHVVDDWPWGRQQRCTMSFFVEENNKRGERLVKQSKMNGRFYKPKTGTYATRVKIVEIDGKIGHVRWSNMHGIFEVNIEDGKYCSKTFFDDEAKQLARKFFGVQSDCRP